MAKQVQQNDSLDLLVRRIVREEIQNVFSGAFQSEEGEYAEVSEDNEPSTLNASGSGSSSARSQSGRRGRRAKNGKGRATNPSTDKRFKENRDA